MEDEVKKINLVERIITHMLVLKELGLFYLEKSIRCSGNDRKLIYKLHKM